MQKLRGTNMYTYVKCLVIIVVVSGVCIAETGDVYVIRALRVRKALGGGWRKPGPLAAVALVAMDDAPERFQKDHEHAKAFAAGCL